MVPGESMHGFLVSQLQDFFEYVAMIRKGLVEGNFLWHNPYAPPSYPPILIHPLFLTLGHVARITHIDQFQMYFWSRFASVLLLTACIYRLAFRVLHTKRGQLLSILFFFTATSIWERSSCGGIPCLADPVTYSQAELNAFHRLLLLPPHHYLGICLLVMLFFHLVGAKINYRNGILTILLGLGISLIHSYVAIYTLGIFIVYSTVCVFMRKKELLPLFLHIFILCAVSLPILYMTQRNGTTHFGTTISFFFSRSGPHITPLTYLQAMGLIVVPSVVGFLTFPTWKKNPFLILVALWGLLPAIWYYTPLGLFKGSPHRLFQLMPQIPLGIMGAYGLSYLSERFKRVGGLFIGVTSVIFILYVLPIYTVGFPYITTTSNAEFTVNKLVKFLYPLIPLLQQHTRKGSVVIAGNRLANMIPAFTHNHVVNGAVGDTPNYPVQADEVRQFFFGLDGNDAVTAFLKKYDASAVIFGVDSISFDLYANRTYPGFKNLYDQGGVSLFLVTNKN